MRWTTAQQQTIETRDKNILVSAAAGSGKTTVLIERIKQLVLRDRVDIDRFLITTFTNAAAAEMKEKMERAIHQEMDRLQTEPAADPDRSGPEAGGGAEPPALTGAERSRDLAYLQRQLDLMPQASISTFHTFAIGIMRDFFYLTDLQPGFLIGDETRLSIMRKESADELFERRFQEDSEAFRAFLRKYSSERNDERLKEQLLNIYQQLRSIPRYMDWAKERTALLQGEDPLGDLGIDSFILVETQDALTDAIGWYRAAAEQLDSEETGSLFLKARQDAEKLEEIRAMAAGAAGDPDESPAQILPRIQKALEEFRPNQMRAAKEEKDAFEVLKEDVGRLRKQGKGCLDALRRNYYDQPLEEHRRILRKGAGDTAYFVGMIQELEQLYLEKKLAQHMVDFDDCMHYVIGILEDETAASDIRERYRYIFIDEYQDSNLLQEEIVSRIAREDNLFMVGDVKQSIYKFRLAEPEIFRRRYELYRSGEDPRSIRIDLNSNFRSRRRIRDAVNRIFEAIMEGYDEDARLNGPAQEEDPGFPVSLHILDRSGAKEEPAPGASGADAEPVLPDEVEELSELQIIAGIIREHLGRPITDRDGTVRPIGYGDIAVLSRGGSMIPQIERYLNNEGIPAFGETAGGYYETVEIQVFLNLLKVISNLNQDVPLISAMHSVIFDFTPRELAQIRIECREGSYYSALRRYEEEGADGQIREKISGMLQQIRLWKEISRTVPLDELMRTLLYDTGYYDYCSGLPAGEQRVSNLRLLLERAAAYEETSYLGLYGFLAYVEAMRKTKQKVSEASLMGEGRSVVHVMTVHKSKGLEFPVVILSGAGKQILGPSDGRAPVMHKDLAIGLAEVDREHHWERKTILQKAIAGKKRREGLEEEIRILYVALTRPMLKLAIVGTVKDAAKLQRFVRRSSFLEMIYGSMMDMAQEDPASAEVFVYQEGSELPGSQMLCSDTACSDTACSEAVPFVPADPAEAGEASSAPIEPEPVDFALIDRRLSWRYPYEQQQSIRSKYSVTELARMEEESSGLPAQIPQRIPRLELPDAAADPKDPSAQQKLSAARIGTAMHTVMEHIDFASALEGGLPYVQRMIDDLHERGFLTDAEYDAVHPEHIDRFFRTELGARAARADLLVREQEFLLRKELEGVPTIVQGIIDCYFEDEKGLVLIDYKNSWIGSFEGAGESEQEETREEVLVRRYAGQIHLYREALEEALRRPVDEAWLYLFRSGTFVPVPRGSGVRPADHFSGVRPGPVSI